MVSGVVLLCLFQPAFAEAPTEPAQIYDSLKNLEGKWSLSAADIQEGGTKTHPSVLHLLGSDQVAMSGGPVAGNGEADGNDVSLQGLFLLRGKGHALLRQEESTRIPCIDGEFLAGAEV
jgi:hypothetical protein